MNQTSSLEKAAIAILVLGIATMTITIPPIGAITIPLGLLAGYWILFKE